MATRSLIFANNAVTETTSATQNPSSTTVFVEDVSNFPVPTATTYFKVTFENASTGEVEIAHCTAVNAGNNSMTVSRGEEGTTAITLAPSTRVSNRITRDTMNEVWTRYIDDLLDVEVGTLNDGDILAWNLATSKWTTAAGSIYRGIPLVGTTYQYDISVPTTTVSGADRNAETLAYTVGREQVFVNGLKQIKPDDYSASDGTSVTFTSTLNSPDQVEIVAYNEAATAWPATAEKLDDISSGFDGVTVTFDLEVLSSPVTPADANNLLIFIEGVPQEPGVSYTVSTSQITFIEAPPAGSSFWGLNGVVISS